MPASSCSKDGLMVYEKMNIDELRDEYWTLEIELSEIASKYHVSDDEMIDNIGICCRDDRIRVRELLWLIVDCLNWFWKKKKKGHLEVVK